MTAHKLNIKKSKCSKFSFVFCLSKRFLFVYHIQCIQHACSWRHSPLPLGVCTAFVYGLGMVRPSMRPSSCLCSFDCRMNFFSLINVALYCNVHCRAVGENVCNNTTHLCISKHVNFWVSCWRHTHTGWWHRVCAACTNDTIYDELALVLLTVASTGFYFYFPFSPCSSVSFNVFFPLVAFRFIFSFWFLFLVSIFSIWSVVVVVVFPLIFIFFQSMPLSVVLN